MYTVNITWQLTMNHILIHSISWKNPENNVNKRIQSYNKLLYLHEISRVERSTEMKD